MADPKLEKTIQFVKMFDKFFDCLNVSYLDAEKHTRNKFKGPYRSASDFRIEVKQQCYSVYIIIVCYFVVFVFTKWLKNNFLGYLDRWEKSVEGRKEFNKTQRNKMMLSSETLSGLRLTGKC